jgi:hypothetical protein
MAAAWWVTGVIAIVDAAWMVSGAWHFALGSLARLAFALLALLAPLALVRYRREPRINCTVRAGALLLGFSSAGAVLSYLVVSTGAPLIDAPLAQWDRSLGFDWLAVWRWMNEHPAVHAALRIAYHSGLPQIACVVLILGFGNRRAQLEGFVIAYMAAVLACIAISGAFPAAGPWNHYSLASVIDVSPLSHFEPLRDGRLRSIDLASMQGLISIPSMHAATAILIVHALRGTRWLAAAAALNVAMIAGTPIEGGHYFVDVIAGVALALLLIAVARRPRPVRSREVSSAPTRGQLGSTTP